MTEGREDGGLCDDIEKDVLSTRLAHLSFHFTRLNVLSHVLCLQRCLACMMWLLPQGAKSPEGRLSPEGDYWIAIGPAVRSPEPTCTCAE